MNHLPNLEEVDEPRRLNLEPSNEFIIDQPPIIREIELEEFISLQLNK